MNPPIKDQRVAAIVKSGGVYFARANNLLIKFIVSKVILMIMNLHIMVITIILSVFLMFYLGSF